MNEDIDSILNSLFRGGKLNLGQSSQEEKTQTEKTLEEMEKINRTLSQSLQSDIEALTREVQEETAAPAVPDMQKLSDENRKVADTQTSAGQAESGNLLQKLHEDFAAAEEEVNQAVIGQSAFVASLALAFKRPYVTGIRGSRPSASVVIMGRNGTGRHMTVEHFAVQLQKRGILTSGRVRYLDLSRYSSAESEKVFVQDLYAAARDETQVLVFENFEKAHSHILSMTARLFEEGAVPLSGRYAEQKGMLVDIGNALVPGAVSSISVSGKYLFLLTDKNEARLLDAFGAPFLKACDDICLTAAFSPQDLQKIAEDELKRLCEEAKKQLGYRLRFETFAAETLAAKFIPEEGAESLKAYTDLLYKALAEYKLRHDTGRQEGVIQPAEGELRIVLADVSIGAEDYSAKADREKAVREVKEELEEIVGLDKVKQYILSLEDNFFIQQMRREKGLKTDFPAMHMIFTGNPGTGKTTVARLVSRYLKAIGVLSGGQLIEVTRADLVGRYVGHTAPLTQKAIESALGGVLFIDEAYSLYRGKDDSFGLEAIDTLVKGMEDNRDNLVVILAGYTREMEEFLTANSGLKSRFPNIIEFEDYTAQELLLITKSMVKAKGYILDASCDEPLLAYFARQQGTGDAATGGNARMARNKLEEAILNCSRRNRAAGETERNLELLLPEDFHV